MCYHVSNQFDAEEVAREFRLPEVKLDLFKKQYDFNGFEKPYLPVISKENPKELTAYRWRLVPSWVKEEKDWKANTLNARNDELFTKASYRDSWQNRCLVICTGFFEPHYPELGAKEHESWYIKPKNKKFFALGAIYSVWKGIPTFSIVTKDATPKMAAVHNDGERQPLILTGNAALSWLIPNLTQNEMINLMEFPYPDDQLDAYRTVDGIYNAKQNTNVPEAIKPYERPAFDALDLFGL
ncbi:SOS response-associated peptidase [Dyadobacter psychrotolerans]|uniref:Abasic site processing protein n=1 Tax=Dyadobacter psychrotolerans TaxID=2541721 RepID=A0A4R5DJ38_9BACT|nr:SOS response-associated peptidase family protein [Dyadobacter psychrotolerans]TDE10805.1 SOS response-associated peptidase [Dyadobacter psychrotolerans]